jgi:hypothetical protein
LLVARDGEQGTPENPEPLGHSREEERVATNPVVALDGAAHRQKVVVESSLGGAFEHTKAFFDVDPDEVGLVGARGLDPVEPT